MPVFVLTVVVLLIVYFVSQRAESEPKGPIPPAGVANVPVKHEPPKVVGSNIVDAAARFLANEAGKLVQHEESRTVLSGGFALAATVLVFNIAAGVIIAAVAWLIAFGIELAFIIDELSNDRSAQGLVWFDETWEATYTKMKNDMENRAYAASPVVASSLLLDIDTCAKAYADGFTQRLNYLRAASGWSKLYNDVHGVNSAYMAGVYGGTKRPRLTEDGAKAWGAYMTSIGTLAPPIPTVPLPGDIDSPYCNLINSWYWGNYDRVSSGGFDGVAPYFDGMNGGIYGVMMYDIFPPNAHVYRPSYWTPRSGNVDALNTSALVAAYGMMGEQQANAGMFLCAYQKGAPAGFTVGASLGSSLALWRKRGVFQGVILPDTYPGFGVKLGDCECYTPDNGQSVRFMKIPEVPASLPSKVNAR